MSSLYRFTTFQELVDIVQRKQLTLVSPSLWSDPYEGYVYAALKTAEGRKRVTDELATFVASGLNEATLNVLSNMDAVFFCQCWSKIPESDALWRIYSHENRSIRIEKEVRVICFDYDNINNVPRDKVKRVSFPLDGFIKSVMLHPLAHQWFDETLAAYCSSNSINYLWKSKLYQFKIHT